MLWCKHLNYQRVNTWVVQHNDTNNWFQHKLCCITDLGYDKVSSITKEGLKLMPAWWRSQPNKCRVRERQPITDRHQSISLKCLCLKLYNTWYGNGEEASHCRCVYILIWFKLYHYILSWLIVLTTYAAYHMPHIICSIWHACNLID